MTNTKITQQALKCQIFKKKIEVGHYLSTWQKKKKKGHAPILSPIDASSLWRSFCGTACSCAQVMKNDRREKKINLRLTMMIILGWTLEDGVIRIEAARRTSRIGRVQALTHVGLLIL